MASLIDPDAVHMMGARMPISRRKMLAGLGAGATSLSVQAWRSSASAQQTRTRFSATSPQGKQMLAKYAKAVGMMMDASKFPKGDPRSWEFQWYSHWIPGPQRPWPDVVKAKTDMLNKVYAGKPPNDPNRLLAQAMWDGCQAHGDNPSDPNAYVEYFFLSWHRYFVYYFEEVIRGVLNDQTFTLPYWDYLGGNVADLSMPPEFFQDTSSPLFRQNRNAWVNQGKRIDMQNPGVLNLNAFNETVYINTPAGSIGFCPILDNNPHGQVHVLVGTPTNMGHVPYAGGDPIFWLHHCNLDRLWESWNRLPNRNNPVWPDRSFPFVDSNGKPVSVKIAGANRVALLKYQYDRYYVPKKIVPVAAAGPLLAFAAAPTTKLAAPSEVTLGADRVRVQLGSPGGPANELAPAKPLALSAPSRQQYLVLGGVSAPDNVDSVYNVYLDLPEGAPMPGPEDPHFVGALNFFHAAGHADHGGGHSTAFNVTETIMALQSKGQLTPYPTVTLQRVGSEPEGAKPMVRQVYLVEA